MTEPIAESLKKLVLMEADLTRLLEVQAQVHEMPSPLDLEASLRATSEITTRVVANQRQIIELLIHIAKELDSRRQP